MKRNAHILTRLALALVVTATATAGISVSFVGGIDDGLSAPTSIDVTGNRLAILEPFSQQLKIYTPDGVMQYAVHLTGRVQGLQAVSESLYLFSDRSKRKIMAIDTDRSSQYEFGKGLEFADPTDLLVRENNLYVLDGGNGEIIELDFQGHETRRLAIIDGEGKAIHFASSFACDPLDGRFFVFDQTRSEVWVLGGNGDFLNRFCSFGGNDGQITRGGEILYDRDGYVYVSDRYQNRVAVFTDLGAYVTGIELADISQSSVALPSGLALDDEGLLYVASTEGAAISIFHIEKAETDNQALAAEQLFPAADDTIAASGVIISAQLTLADVVSDPVKFDFRLYQGTGEGEPIMGATGIEPVAVEGQSGILLAQWQPGEELTADMLYSWQVRVRLGEIDGSWSALRGFRTASLPRLFRLEQNYPNPFNPETRIAYSIPQAGLVRLAVINILGQTVRILGDQYLEAGDYEEIWNGRDDNGEPVASGVYFYRLTAESMSQTKKMVLLK